jgi:hypothetical protein
MLEDEVKETLIPDASVALSLSSSNNEQKEHFSDYSFLYMS